MIVSIYGPNLRTQGQAIHVHRTGCSDTSKAFYRGHTPWVIDVENVKDLTLNIYDPSDFDYDEDVEWERYSDDIKVFPCAALPRLSPDDK